ncbi:MAG: hypothetical protein K1000chlam3_00275 [Chlamydiae bacterium]|nr:hypothetical protein [Chlamydiota bacterium]
MRKLHIFCLYMSKIVQIELLLVTATKNPLKKQVFQQSFLSKRIGPGKRHISWWDPAFMFFQPMAVMAKENCPVRSDHSASHGVRSKG